MARRSLLRSRLIPEGINVQLRKLRSRNVRRSYLRFYDWPMLLLFIPIRCRDCHARFYMFRFGKASLIFHA